MLLLPRSSAKYRRRSKACFTCPLNQRPSNPEYSWFTGRPLQKPDLEGINELYV